jgi:hypothetical protein
MNALRCSHACSTLTGRGPSSSSSLEQLLSIASQDGRSTARTRMLSSTTPMDPSCTTGTISWPRYELKRSKGNFKLNIMLAMQSLSWCPTSHHTSQPSMKTCSVHAGAHVTCIRWRLSVQYIESKAHRRRLQRYPLCFAALRGCLCREWRLWQGHATCLVQKRARNSTRVLCVGLSSTGATAATKGRASILASRNPFACSLPLSVSTLTPLYHSPFHTLPFRSPVQVQRLSLSFQSIFLAVFGCFEAVY